MFVGVYCFHFVFFRVLTTHSEIFYFQYIVISGESDAAKTESANFMVQQLTQLGKV